MLLKDILQQQVMPTLDILMVVFLVQQSTIDRIHYFNDTVDALPRGQLTTARESSRNRQC